MNVNKHEYIESDYVYKVVGCAMSVMNELGHGLREKTYERALCVEFDLQKVSYSCQEIFKVYYKGNHIDDYIPDLIIPKHLIVELKTVERICDEHIGQVLNYLKITGLEAGMILNFTHAKLEWRKIVLTKKEKN